MIKSTVTIVAILLFLAGCGAGKQSGGSGGFFTSGSKEADQRADQRMAKSEQLQGGGEGAGEKKAKPAKPEEGKPAQAEGKITLYDRLGGEDGLKKITGDFIDRALADPRVNWERKGVTKGGLGISRGQSVTWNASPDKVEQLKKHVVQMLSIATGGPAHYDGLEMKQAHTGLKISNPEFDAAVGDLKATLDKLQTPNKEQKELLAIVESTRPQVVEER